jgi:L-lactate dehydrogenase (cytochrome)
MGQEGVTKALQIIHKELDLTMAFCGLRDVKALSRDILIMPERM